MLNDASLTIALALAAGIFCQALARHLAIPSILLLLLVGVGLGPDGANIVRPQTLDGGLAQLVSFAVAVILFEGGLSLNVHRIRQQQRTLRRLVFLAPVVVTGAAGVVARYILGIEWSLAILFGTLVIVTGPTVVNPLMKRMNVETRVRSILEAEGVMTDAVGAVIAVVVLDIVISPSFGSAAFGVVEVLKRLGFGLLFGGAAGLLLGLLLQPRRVIPEQLRNVVVLCMVFAVFHLADAMVHESGIAATTMAGAIVGNMKTRGAYHLAEFKEQLTAMLIGLLFVLLSADVRFEDIAALGLRGVAVVAVLVLLIRPLHAAVATFRSDLRPNERWFIAAIAPRGIVAAAVASLFATRLQWAGIEGGTQLRALVFLVIALTVAQAAIAGPILARFLDLKRPSGRGWLLLGADALGRLVAEALKRAGAETLNVDLDPDATNAATTQGLATLTGNGMKADVLRRAGIDTREGIVATARRDEVNLLFVERARRVSDVGPLIVTLTPEREAANCEILKEIGGHLLFGEAVDHAVWVDRLEQHNALLEEWRAGRTRTMERLRRPAGTLLFVAYRRKKAAGPVCNDTTLRRGAKVWVLVDRKKRREAHEWLRQNGFEPKKIPAAD